MKIFILTIGTRGDLELFLILGRELQRRGHHVLVGTSRFYGPNVRASHLEFIPIGSGTQQQMNGVLRSLASFGDLKQRTLGFIQYWVAPQLKEAMRLFLSCAATANYFVSNLKMNIQMKGRIIPGAYVTYDVPESLTDLARPGTAQRDGAVIDLVALNKQLVDPDDRWGSAFRFTGFWKEAQQPQYSPPPQLAAFIAGGPPVIVTLGSMNPLADARLITTVTKVIQAIGQRALVLGHQSALSSSQNGIMLFGEEVPYDWLFPQAACVVHHGGAGTVAAALSAGILSVLLPQIAAQEFMANVLLKAGASVAAFPVGLIDSTALGLAIQQAVSADRRAVAQKWQSRLGSERGASTAADCIEEHRRSLPIL